MRELVERFTIRTDDGEEFGVLRYQNYVDASGLKEPGKMLPSLQELCLADGGGHVNVRDDGTFQRVATGMIARRVEGEEA